ncbi:glycosyltransferase family 2 protein [Pontibacter arcticus]|uniref:Glycosyltransferase family 2 protein n=1 Tax=Pontibacter arcticus TaxID=2080288 RepID=A0A364RG68_9BACT|nr:glycosyltransferase family A protein [Pontibacter arcticus]RAU83289.1 glycosyltransferase family 2 protein [Pontibacter arcticus]
MLVSVLIPCYNVEAYIEDCLASVYKQTYPSIEVICIDNNSTDGTASVLLTLQEKYPQLILCTETKKGANAARNKGLQLANGEWVQFLDADDLLEPGKIAHQVALILSNADISFIAASSIKLSLGGIRQESIVKQEDVWFALCANKLGITSANLFRIDAALRAGGWNEALQSSQETDLMFRLLQRGAIVFFDGKPLTVIRERASGSISQLNITSNLERYIRLRHTIYTYLVKIKYDSKVVNAILQIIFNKIREVYTYDAGLGIALYNELIPAGFKPGLTAITGKFYLISYSLIGFKYTEAGKDFLRKLIK